ncbi:hypothetical protein V8E36_003300 [Tilletia maclaganii]
MPTAVCTHGPFGKAMGAGIFGSDDVYSLAAPLVRKCSERPTSTRLFKTRKANAKEKAVERFEDVQRTDIDVFEQLLDKVSPGAALVCADPGKSTLLYATASSRVVSSPCEVNETDRLPGIQLCPPPTFFKHTEARRQRDLGTHLFRQRRMQFERNLTDPVLAHALASFQHSTIYRKKHNRHDASWREFILGCTQSIQRGRNLLYGKLAKKPDRPRRQSRSPSRLSNYELGHQATRRKGKKRAEESVPESPKDVNSEEDENDLSESEDPFTDSDAPGPSRKVKRQE